MPYFFLFPTIIKSLGFALWTSLSIPTIDSSVVNFQSIPLFLFFSMTAFSQATAPQLGAIEASLLKQRDSITLQIASLKKMNPGAFNITRVPGDEPVTQLARRSDCNGGTSGPIEPVISLAASRAGISSDLVRAVILQESAFDPCAVSSKGALGLMQLMPATARQLGVSNPFDPKQNVEAGAGLLRQLIDRYGGDLSLALSAYNAGPSRVDRAGGVPNITETTNYVRSVLANLRVE